MKFAKEAATESEGKRIHYAIVDGDNGYLGIISPKNVDMLAKGRLCKNFVRFGNTAVKHIWEHGYLYERSNVYDSQFVKILGRITEYGWFSARQGMSALSWP